VNEKAREAMERRARETCKKSRDSLLDCWGGDPTYPPCPIYDAALAALLAQDAETRAATIEECCAAVASTFGISEALGAEIMFVNDNDFSWRTQTPEERFAEVREWVVTNIKPQEAAP
jgi:hypothetical protein